MDLPLPDIAAFPVEAGHIKLFARAIGDPNPIYADAQYAAATPCGGIIAPPTFVEAGMHFDEAFPFRPRPGQAWMGSGATPTGLSPDDLPGGTDLHAETHFEYFAPLRPGMVLRVASRNGNTWEKVGSRAGRLQFFETISEYRDAQGELLVVCRTVGVRTQNKVEQKSRTSRSPAEALSLSAQAAYPVPPLRADELKVGETRSRVVAANLTRAQIMMYAGASGDFSPQHVDEVFNRQVAGYPSVFAHGMLTMAMTGRVLTDWLGDGKLRKFGFQFREQLWPGDSVSVTAEVTAVRLGGGEAEFALTTTNQAGAAIGKGYAMAALDV